MGKYIHMCLKKNKPKNNKTKQQQKNPTKNQTKPKQANKKPTENKTKNKPQNQQNPTTVHLVLKYIE